ncbi:response regulator [Dethiosulfatarculus sandiegensis]|uniref:Response regulatory domain-containing protein n=1 Tax=Dethiosulfatarculus sandiegensis TaxID=1429043 RepID=A0A0D2JQ26_9BACT|nr:response regulator [Dethiosulfatarculus sandiegensis]KIX11580.1 hypothetical protein X474_24670 [Dethiosulfatarculus sandiegensis]
MKGFSSEQLCVLVVDSQKGPGENCVRILEQEGYHVRLADGGKAALKLAGQNQFDIVFLDLRLPKKPGMVVLEEMIAIQPEAIFVAMTDRATVTLALDALRQGAHEFLTKPCTPEELRNMAARAKERCCLALERKIKACRLSDETLIKPLAVQLRGRSLAVQERLKELEQHLTGHPASLTLLRKAMDDNQGMLKLLDQM